MKTFIAWCFFMTALFAPAMADGEEEDISSVIYTSKRTNESSTSTSPSAAIGVIVGIVAGVILAKVLYCVCMYYICRCCWLCCNKDANNVTVVQQSQMAAAAPQPIILNPMSTIGMGSSQMPGYGPVYGNMGSNQVPACGNMGSSQMSSYDNMESIKVPAGGSTELVQVCASGNMYSSEDNRYSDTVPLVTPPPYKV